MATTKNLCAQISLDLHQKISEGKEAAGLTTAQYITELLTEYFKMKENGGKTTMANNSRTMAFQIPEDLFQRIKAHLERETQRTGRKLTLSAPMRFCSFSANRKCRKMAGKGVQPLNNYTCRFRPSSLKQADKSGLDGLQTGK